MHLNFDSVKSRNKNYALNEGKNIQPHFLITGLHAA